MNLSKIPFGAFRQVFAVCCAHNLFAYGEQIPHLQPELCFCPRTRRGQKRFGLYAPHPRRTLQGIFNSLKARHPAGFLYGKFKVEIYKRLCYTVENTEKET